MIVKVLVKVVRLCFGLCFDLTSQRGGHEQKRPFGECVGPKIARMGPKVAKIGPTTCSKTKKALEDLVLNFAKRATSRLPCHQHKALTKRSFVRPLTLDRVGGKGPSAPQVTGALFLDPFCQKCAVNIEVCPPKPMSEAETASLFSKRLHFALDVDAKLCG